jgi:hypothetical protein
VATGPDAATRRDAAMVDPDAIILGGGDGERLRRVQQGLLQLTALIGAAHGGSIENGDLAALMMILHDEMGAAMGGAIPPSGVRH